VSLTLCTFTIASLRKAQPASQYFSSNKRKTHKDNILLSPYKDFKEPSSMALVVANAVAASLTSSPGNDSLNIYLNNNFAG
jgi:hypothetical protein